MATGRAREIADVYARDVLDGKIVAGRYIHLACQRWFDDWENRERKGFRWSDERADHFLDFALTCRHYQGEWAEGADRDGRPCDHGEGCDTCHFPQAWSPEPWQVFQLANVFGWLVERRGKWRRRFTKVYDQEARKNGKTFKLGAIGLYIAFLDGEKGAEVYSAATKHEQAKRVWRAAAQILKRTPELQGLGIERRGSDLPRSSPTLFSAETACKFLPIGADSETEDGANVHGALIDEFHAHKDDGLVGVLETALGSRGEPLEWIITTAGETVESPCGYERAYGIDVLTGTTEDESYFVTIYELDEADEDTDTAADDYQDESNWPKANPNLGVSVFAEVLRDNLKRAQHNPVKLAEVKRKHFNLWAANPKKSYIPLTVWDRCKGSRPDSQLAGLECYGAFDLASRKDLSAKGLLFPPQKGLTVWTYRVQSYLPEAALLSRTRRERKALRAAADQGHLTLTEGDITDYRIIRRALREDSERYGLQGVAYDPQDATMLSTTLRDEDGIPTVQCPQNVSTYNEPMKLVDELVRRGEFDHGKNPLLRQSIDNIAVKVDEHERWMPSKRMSQRRIDPTIPLFLAFKLSMLLGLKKHSIYEPGAVASGRSVYESA